MMPPIRFGASVPSSAGEGTGELDCYKKFMRSSAEVRCRRFALESFRFSLTRETTLSLCFIASPDGQRVSA